MLRLQHCYELYNGIEQTLFAMVAHKNVAGMFYTQG